MMLGTGIKRRFHTSGFDAPMTVDVGKDGILIRVKGSRLPLTISWAEVVAHSRTPGNVPSYLAGKPWDLLRFEATKYWKKQQKTPVTISHEVHLPKC